MIWEDILIDHFLNIIRISYNFFRFFKNISNSGDGLIHLDKRNQNASVFLYNVGMSAYKSIIDVALTQTSPWASSYIAQVLEKAAQTHTE